MEIHRRGESRTRIPITEEAATRRLVARGGVRLFVQVSDPTRNVLPAKSIQL